jgi:RimJ/RimL family protein N-acetyltransferase
VDFGTQQPVVTIEGVLVALGPLRHELLPTYHRWITDLATLRTLDQPPLPVTLEQEQAWYEQAIATIERVMFTIYQRSNWEPIGNTDLRDIDFRKGTAEFGILIGDPAARGKGFGTEATRLVLDYAFTVLGLRNVLLRTAEFNLAGRRAYEKAGFREVGRRRLCRPIGDRWGDDVYMDCVSTEFASPVLAKIYQPDESRNRHPDHPSEI